MSFDWTQISDDPNDRQARDAVRTLLPSLRRVHTDTDLLGFILKAAQGRSVLDIGVVEHSARYIDRETWRHGKIAAAATRCIGIDIIEPLVNDLNVRGFDVRCVDATSDVDMGERFGLVFIGDVIEHVENPGALLRFAARHLLPEGRLLVATPNPFSRKFMRQFLRQGVMVVNLDHLAWFSPTMALELARRTDLDFAAYHLVKPMDGLRLTMKRFAWWLGLSPVEFSFPDYLFEFALRRK